MSSLSPIFLSPIFWWFSAFVPRNLRLGCLISRSKCSCVTQLLHFSSPRSVPLDWLECSSSTNAISLFHSLPPLSPALPSTPSSRSFNILIALIFSSSTLSRSSSSYSSMVSKSSIDSLVAKKLKRTIFCLISKLRGRMKLKIQRWQE